MKSFFSNITAIFVLMALTFSCTLNVENVDSREEQLKAQPTAVGFGMYLNRGTTTKAGYAGVLTTDILKLDNVGFGVFAYYGDGALYNEASKPDFMYNQKVTYNTSAKVWDYTPIKYWPNEFGAEASSESADRLSFFAYSPYVEVTPTTGIVTGDTEYGIISMSRNIAVGDPMVMYSAKLQPGYGGVDLCWGVAANNFTSSVDGNNSNNVAKGDPYLNLIKPKTGDKILFEFNHALTQLNVQIDAQIDEEDGNTNTLDSKTKVYVRSITFTGFTTRGSLNLNSKAGSPLWYNITGTGRLNREPVTIYDGRSDGLEGVATASDISETPATLNPKIIQSAPYAGTPTPGVTNTPENLFAYAPLTADPVPYVTEKDAPVMVIPVFGVPVKVTIVYDVETIDPNLSTLLSDGVTHGVSTQNTITKTVQMNGQDMTLESGKKYVIALHLGLTSVKFDAAVADWTDAQYEGTAYLPVNNDGFKDPVDITSSAERIVDGTSWTTAYGTSGSALKAYEDDNPDEDLWNTVANRAANFNDKEYTANIYTDAAGTTPASPATGTFKREWVDSNVQKVVNQATSDVFYMTINPDLNTVYELFTDNTLQTSAGKFVSFTGYSFPDCVKSWKGAVNAPGALFPWACYKFDTPFVGKVEFIYDGGEPKYPFGTEARTFNSYFVVSLPALFNHSAWKVREDGSSDETFDWSKLVINLYEAK